MPYISILNSGDHYDPVKPINLCLCTIPLPHLIGNIHQKTFDLTAAFTASDSDSNPSLPISGSNIKATNIYGSSMNASKCGSDMNAFKSDSHLNTSIPGSNLIHLANHDSRMDTLDDIQLKDTIHMPLPYSVPTETSIPLHSS